MTRPDQDPDAAILVRALRKSFGPVEAVRDVDFAVAKGEVLGFLGPNGAGKSTTMKMITGFLPASAGEIRVCGHDIRSQPIAARRRIGYLPEGAPLYGEMTTLQLLRFVASVRELRGPECRRRIDAVIGALELEQVLHQQIESLSKGFKRRVGLAQAVLHDPEVLILDEPTDGLDPNQKHQVRGFIRSLGQEKAIIISTHLLEEVDAICGRALIMDRGTIRFSGTPSELHALAPGYNSVWLRIRSDDEARAVDLLSALPRVASVESRREAEGTSALTVCPVDAAPVADAVAAELRGAGVHVIEMSIDGGRLDEVFRKVTRGGDGQVH